MILKKNDTGRIEIDLTGPDGNVFYLLGMAKRISKELAKDGDFYDTDAILEDMMSADYEHAVEVLEEKFGHIITMYR